MSTLFSLESAAAQVGQTRRQEAERARLARSLRRRSTRSPRHSAAAALRGWADRLEPEKPCLDC